MGHQHHIPTRLPGIACPLFHEAGVFFLGQSCQPLAGSSELCVHAWLVLCVRAMLQDEYLVFQHLRCYWSLSGVLTMATVRARLGRRLSRTQGPLPYFSLQRLVTCVSLKTGCPERVNSVIFT